MKRVQLLLWNRAVSLSGEIVNFLVKKVGGLVFLVNLTKKSGNRDCRSKSRVQTYLSYKINKNQH